MPPKPKKKEVYHFSIVKNFPKYKSFEILKEPEADFLSAFVRTLSQLFKGD
ncbi:hypothetical protein GF412_02010 [Candidatus Micrarchaeota archaeon]|nr:hypothetical protein [Candidatus Micrarchaeota archaeon]MBD3417737.1 hypothetical protein [Candidatus Micrarchaeota archaeon]